MRQCVKKTIYYDVFGCNALCETVNKQRIELIIYNTRMRERGPHKSRRRHQRGRERESSRDHKEVYMLMPFCSFQFLIRRCPSQVIRINS